MRSSLFITGAGGYVGTRLVARLLAEHECSLRLLVRDPAGLDRRVRDAARITVVQGDLLDPSSYSKDLVGCDYVVHLAALTGKGRRSDYERVNAEGTGALLTAAKNAGVRGFMHVSSVAVKFADQTSYWYAHSKVRAERLVRESGLPFTIVRPTMILGPGAPLLESLGKLATAPVVPVFGRGDVEVQPVHVDDLVALVIEFVRDAEFSGETVDVGGADAVAIEELLQRMRESRTGSRGRSVHLPLRPLRAMLSIAEPALLPVLPLTAGQLATFANVGKAAPHRLMEGREMAGLAAMLDAAAPAKSVAGSRSAGMGLGPEETVREGKALGRYLGGAQPSDYVLTKYAEFEARNFSPPESLLDRVLLGAACRLPFGVRLADVYSARLHKASVLRRRLVLMLALLECAPPSARRFDTVIRRGRVAAFADMGVRAGIEALALVVAVVVFGPVHVVSALRGGRGVEERA